MGSFLKNTLAVVLGIVLGLASIAGYLTLSRYTSDSVVENGPWTTLLNAGSKASNPHERLVIALRGLLALAREETLYYTAFSDSSGERLKESCDYLVEGRDPPARWWSVTAYAADNFLPMNPDGHLSISRSTVQRDENGAFRIRLSPEQTGVNWVSTRNAGRYSITLRLYNPGPEAYADPAGVPLPKIIRLGCA